MKPLILWLSTVVVGLSAIDDPSKYAITFLENLRQFQQISNNSAAEPTEISRQTTEAKKEFIHHRWRQLKRELSEGPLKVAAARVDDDLAAVLIHPECPRDSSRAKAFAIALIKNHETWQVTPMPASFENSNIKHTLDTQKRTTALEIWMLREQVVVAEKLRTEIADRLQQKIEAATDRKQLLLLSPREFTKRFLTACTNRDLPAILGCLGGLSSSLPADWTNRIRMANLAVQSSPKTTHTWHLLTAPEVLRTLVNLDESTDPITASIACLDASTSQPDADLPKVELVDCVLMKRNDHLWRIDPPSDPLQSNETETTETNNVADQKMAAAFPAHWADENPLTPQATAELAHHSWLTAIQEPSPGKLLLLSDLKSPATDATKTCIQAAKLWWSIHQPDAINLPIPLAMRASENSAAAVVQWFSPRDPTHFEPKILSFQKSSSGWLWTFAPNPESYNAIRDWVATETKNLATHWQEILLAECSTITPNTNRPSPSIEDARTWMNTWNSLCQHHDMKQALSLTLRLTTPESDARILQNVGYDIVASNNDPESRIFTKVYQEKNCSAVGAKVILKNGEVSYPLYPLINTRTGPKLLAEIDLIALTHNGRDFLNRTALQRLEHAGEGTLAGELRSILAKHEADIKKH
ncbi:MAG: hypothetical protein ORN51_11745 [Akkermansiaceae bacterium]|nr:hypothetical protein [Akkermansiaceae bacterium]